MAMGAGQAIVVLRASAREQALPFETMEYQRRREAADQRRADAQRFLTTPFPVPKRRWRPWSAIALRRTGDRESDRAVQLATQEARIRALKRVGTEPTGDDRLEEPTSDAGLIAGRAVQNQRYQQPELCQPSGCRPQNRLRRQSASCCQAWIRACPDSGGARSAEVICWQTCPASFGRGNVDAGLSLDRKNWTR